MKKRALTAALGSVGLLAAAAAVVLFPSLAGAHTNNVTGSSVCDNGTHTVTWTIKNSESAESGHTETATFTATGGGELNPAKTVIIPAGGSGQVVQSGIPNAATTATLTVDAAWSDGATETGMKGTVTFSGTCTTTVTPVEPTIAQSICNGPGDPSTPKYTIPSTTGVSYLVDGSAKDAGMYALAQGASVTVTATAQTGYALTGKTSWTLTADAKDCISHVTAPPAVFADEKCENLSSVAGTLVVTAKAGITYSVSPASAIVQLGSSSNGSAALPAGSYTVTPGVSVTVTAAASAGYALDGPATFAHTYPKALDCTDHVVPVVPAVTQTACTGPGAVKGASYTIPATTGVVYSVNDSETPVKAGTYPLAQGETVVVHADALTGYTIDGTDEWTITADERNCDVTATPATPTYSAQQCQYPSYTVQPATVTIPSTTGVVYSLDGKVTPAGIVTVAVGPHAVTAAAVEGYELAAYPVAGWTTTITAVPCEVAVLAEPPTRPVLASTGTDSANLAIVGVLVLLAGGGLVALTSRRRRADIEA